MLNCTNLRWACSDRSLICGLGAGGMTGWRFCPCEMLPLTAGKTSGILRPLSPSNPRCTTKPFPRHHICMDLLGKMLFASVQAVGKVGPSSYPHEKVKPRPLLFSCQLQPSWSSSLLEPREITLWQMKIPQLLCTGRISAALSPALGKEGVEITLL